VPDPSPPRDHANAADTPPSVPLSVLVLDDDPDFLQYIRQVLDEAGHETRCVESPQAFYEACETRLPDVALLDIKMGPASGTDVLAEIRRRWPRLCVIVITGYPSLDSMRQTFKLDIFDYLTKPFGVEELRRALAQAAARLGLGRRPQDRLRIELGRQIRLARVERGWTLKDLSENSDVSISQLSAVERGTHMPSLESLLQIAAALGVRPSTWIEHAGF
jgi:CheY-like chemotaxis protein/lambda repressor-like predicted transcriptional regulator